MNHLSTNLQRLRKYHRLTQAEAAYWLSITRTRYSGWEQGESEPSIDMLLALSKLYRISVDRLLTADLAPMLTEDVFKLLRP